MSVKPVNTSTTAKGEHMAEQCDGDPERASACQAGFNKVEAARSLPEARQKTGATHRVVVLGKGYQPHRWAGDALLQPQVRAAYQNLLDQGWTDALRQIHPEGPLWTFWAYLRNRWPADKGLRLDHLLLTPDLADRLVDAGVDRWVRGQDEASDHAPAWIQLGPT